MTERTDLSEQEKEKRTNTRLAVGLGVLGFGAFGSFYALFFLVMILKPGLLFGLMPVPGFTNAAVSDGSTVWLLAEKLDMSDVSPREKREPKTIYLMQPLQGDKPGAHVEIPPYDHVKGGNNKLLFLSEGAYRIYDGNAMTEQKNPAIQKDSRGVITPLGIFVLSSTDKVPVMNIVSGSTSTPVPLAPEYLGSGKEERCLCCTRLLWHQDKLYLFWELDKKLAWTTWDGSNWAAPVNRTEFTGGYDVISDSNRIYYFHRQGKDPDQHIEYYTLDQGNWTGPTRLEMDVKGSFSDWDVLLHEGKLKLFVQHLASPALYTIENGSLVNPVRLERPFEPHKMFGTVAMIAVAGNGFFLLALFGISGVVNRYKRRTWTQDGTEYEFASLSRRFLAHLIDTIVLFLPLAAGAALFASFADFEKNPFLIPLMILSAFLFLIVGTYLYYSLLEGLFGRTLGKKICGIRVLKADFTACTLSAGLLRNLLRIVDLFFYYLVAAIAVAATVKWQRIGDIVAETVVVRDGVRK